MGGWYCSQDRALLEFEIRGGCRIFEKGRVSNLDPHAKKGGSRGSSFGPNVKKPTSWAKRMASRPPPPGPASGDAVLKHIRMNCIWICIGCCYKRTLMHKCALVWGVGVDAEYGDLAYSLEVPSDPPHLTLSWSDPVAIHLVRVSV